MPCLFGGFVGALRGFNGLYFLIAVVAEAAVGEPASGEASGNNHGIAWNTSGTWGALIERESMLPCGIAVAAV